MDGPRQFVELPGTLFPALRDATPTEQEPGKSQGPLRQKRTTTAPGS